MLISYTYLLEGVAGIYCWSTSWHLSQSLCHSYWSPASWKPSKIIPRTINNIFIHKYTWSISRLEKVEDWNWRVNSETLQWKNNSLIFYPAMDDLVNSFTNKSILCHSHAWHTFLTFDLRHSFICPKTSLI